MPLSTRFKELRARLSELRKHMLPEKFSPTGDYTDRQLDRARGYRLLAHAEIEAYLEDIAKETVTLAISEWKKSREPSVLLVAFMAAYHSSWNIDDTLRNDEITKISKSRRNVKDSVNEVIDLAQTQFIQKIQDNHGIKDKNFKTLMLPTGIDIDELDSTWLTNLDNFGEQRGQVAHNTKKVTGLINPEDELKTVKSLLEGLEELDKKINTI